MNHETYYSIFDVCRPIMEENKEIKAGTAIEAVKKYLASIGEGKGKPKPSAENNVRIKAEPFYIKDGTKFRHPSKRSVWYKVETQQNNLID